MLEVHRPSSVFRPSFHGLGTPYKPKTRLCRRLLNAGDCENMVACGASHDMGLYNSRPCKFGPACHRLAKTACKFYHPKSHVMRSQDMTAGLEDGVVLNAFGPVDTTFESYGIRKAEKIAGFNFLDDGRIAVPGLPPTLKPPQQDKKYTLGDHQLHPSEPRNHGPRFAAMLRAVDILRPDVSATDFHVATTAGCLKRLAHFLLRRDRPERLDVEYRDGTLFLARWAGDVWSHVYLGFGKQFEDDVRRFDVLRGPLQASTSSHAVVACELGDGVRALVQAEVDAIHCACHAPSRLWALNREKSASPTPASPAAAGHGRRSSGRYDVLSLDTDGGDDDDDDAARGVVRAGVEVGLECGVEIKTCAKKNTGYDFLAQLYFQQVGKLFLATYDQSGFRRGDMVLRDVADRTVAWEAENQVMLARLVALLKDVRSRAREVADAEGGVCRMALVLGDDGSGEWRAVLYQRRDGVMMVPEDF